jgi:DNA polymerase III delta prime subunit
MSRSRSNSVSNKRRNATAEDWTVKYRPTKLSQMVGDRSHLKLLSTWLTNMQNGTTNQTTAIVSGEHGVGKTLGVELVLRECGYELKTLELAALRTNGGEANGDIRRYLERITKTQNVDAMLLHKEQKKMAIVIDNIDGITSKQEREGLQAVHKYNKKNNLFPLIIISAANHSKLLSKIKDKCFVVTHPQPGYNDMVTMINRICEKEDFKIDNIRDIIFNSQGDMCRLINLMEELRRIYNGRKKIDSKMVKEFCDAMHKKDTNVGLYDQTRMLFHHFPGMEEALRIFSSDKVFVPLMIHENYPAAIEVRKENMDLNNDEVLARQEEIAESISFGDIVENDIHERQLWDMMPSHAFSSYAYPAWLINQWERDQSPSLQIVFARDPNKKFIQKINYGHIETVLPFFSDHSTQNYLTMAMITAKLIAENNAAGLKSLFLGYKNMTDIVIEGLLKINKICGSVKLKRDKRSKLLSSLFVNPNNKLVGGKVIASKAADTDVSDDE